jgi:GT2 family glycosyltransferase
MTSLSVVIPTYQRRESALRALRALSTQTAEPESYEVVLSVDGSSDGTREAAESIETPYRLRICWQENGGRAAACNTGAREAVGEVLAFLDDDMEPSSGFVRGHLDAHPPESRRAVVGPAPIFADPGSPPLVAFRSSGFNSKLARLSRPGYRPKIRDLYCGNFSVSRSLFWEAGGFDEDFTAYGHEDFDLLLRLQALGVELGFAEAALAVQHYEKRLVELAENMLQEGQTAVLFALKHPGILPQLELGTWMERSFRHRFALTALIASTRLLPVLRNTAIGVVARLEKRRSAGLRRHYGRLLEYLFWLGADRALRTQRVGPTWRLSPYRAVSAIESGSSMRIRTRLSGPRH